MKIVHLAPYAPHAAGIYEAARDMLRADVQAGRDACFVDTGPHSLDGKHLGAQIGKADDRGGFRLVTADPSAVDSADVIVQHTGCPDAWTVRTQAPIIFVVHGRPLASYRFEMLGRGDSYSVYCRLAQWPRIKAMVHFWPEFEAYWRPMLAGKDCCIPAPPIDASRFAPDGETHVIEGRHRGAINGLICDSWREDIDIFEVFHGALEAARRVQGLVWHFYGCDRADGPWTHLFRALERIGAMGSRNGRHTDMDRHYRAHDFVLSPQRIVTRTIGEALCCGLPVVAAHKCSATPYTADIQNPHSVAEAVQRVVARIEADRAALRSECLDTAKRFSLDAYAKAIGDVYNKALGRMPLVPEGVQV